MDDGQTSRVSAVNAVGARWREMGRPFLVVHGLEGYPGRLGRDLDVLMDQDLADDALHEADVLLRGLGWLCRRPPDTWGKRIVALKSKGRGDYDYLEFHTLGALRWFVVPLVEASEAATHNVGPFHASHWATFTKAFILPLLARDFDRYTAEYIDRHVHSGVTRKTIQTRSQSVLGHELTEHLMTTLEERNPQGLIDHGPALRRALVGRIARHPFVSIRETPRFLGRKFKAPFDSAGLHVLLKTSQASSLVDLIVAKLDNVFVDVKVGEPGLGRPAIVRMAGRQILIVDLEECSPSEQSQARISVVGANDSFHSLDLAGADEQPEESAARIADWVIARWIEKLELQRSG